MKINTNTNAVVGFFAVLAAVVVLAAGQAHALSLTGSGTATVQATTTVDVGVGIGVGASATATATGTGNSSGSASAAAQLLINQPVPITSTADLATYDDLVVKARPAVTAINFDDNNNVTVQYSQPAKFLGLFPVTISGEVMVDAQGNTAVKLPWWAMFYTKNVAGVQTSVAGAVAGSGADFTADANAQTNVQARVQNEARVIDAVTAALQAQAVASTSVTAQ